MLAGGLKSCGHAKAQLGYVKVKCLNILCPSVGIFPEVPNGILYIISVIIPLRFSLLFTFSCMFCSHMAIQGLLKVPDFDYITCKLLPLQSHLHSWTHSWFGGSYFFAARWANFFRNKKCFNQVTSCFMMKENIFSWFSSIQHGTPTPIMLQTHSMASMEVLCQQFQPPQAEKGIWTHCL